ncbi:hypothetical protein CXG81DRAFT_28469 [Caulochytrium protostelioides]|uniref:F-box domain-containing protein n=1 Tax=Caulochytrium protostelioides TaxID=1555241 RepID=A0A4P9WZ09_9FUNG|nr:hypothetical protein CXG81DRAFT_28469 [Caulochytrium protostelioides]|eukprot:RKO98724.1 hypothetical protein CXG81DRAFT_28469 [Caulochytrium protostelioides]
MPSEAGGGHADDPSHGRDHDAGQDHDDGSDADAAGPSDDRASVRSAASHATHFHSFTSLVMDSQAPIASTPLVAPDGAPLVETHGASRQLLQRMSQPFFLSAASSASSVASASASVSALSLSLSSLPIATVLPVQIALQDGSAGDETPSQRAVRALAEARYEAARPEHRVGPGSVHDDDSDQDDHGDHNAARDEGDRAQAPYPSAQPSLQVQQAEDEQNEQDEQDDEHSHQQHQQDIAFLGLPHRAWLMVASHLTWAEILRVACTAHRQSQLLHDEELFYELCVRHHLLGAQWDAITGHTMQRHITTRLDTRPAIDTGIDADLTEGHDAPEPPIGWWKLRWYLAVRWQAARQHGHAHVSTWALPSGGSALSVRSATSRMPAALAAPLPASPASGHRPDTFTAVDWLDDGLITGTQNGQVTLWRRGDLHTAVLESRLPASASSSQSAATNATSRRSRSASDVLSRKPRSQAAPTGDAPASATADAAGSTTLTALQSWDLKAGQRHVADAPRSATAAARRDAAHGFRTAVLMENQRLELARSITDKKKKKLEAAAAADPHSAAASAAASSESTPSPASSPRSSTTTASGVPPTSTGTASQASPHVTVIASAPDQHALLVVGDWSGTLTFWNPLKGTVIDRAVAAHTTPIIGIAILDDGTVVSASLNGLIRTWRLDVRKVAAEDLVLALSDPTVLAGGSATGSAAPGASPTSTTTTPLPSSPHEASLRPRSSSMAALPASASPATTLFPAASALQGGAGASSLTTATAAAASEGKPSESRSRVSSFRKSMAKMPGKWLDRRAEGERRRADSIDSAGAVTTPHPLTAAIAHVHGNVSTSASGNAHGPLGAHTSAPSSPASVTSLLVTPASSSKSATRRASLTGSAAVDASPQAPSPRSIPNTLPTATRPPPSSPLESRLKGRWLSSSKASPDGPSPPLVSGAAVSSVSSSLSSSAHSAHSAGKPAADSRTPAAAAVATVADSLDSLDLDMVSFTKAIAEGVSPASLTPRGTVYAPQRPALPGSPPLLLPLPLPPPPPPALGARGPAAGHPTTHRATAPAPIKARRSTAEYVGPLPGMGQPGASARARPGFVTTSAGQVVPDWVLRNPSLLSPSSLRAPAMFRKRRLKSQVAFQRQVSRLRDRWQTASKVMPEFDSDYVMTYRIHPSTAWRSHREDVFCLGRWHGLDAETLQDAAGDPVAPSIVDRVAGWIVTGSVDETCAIWELPASSPRDVDAAPQRAAAGGQRTPLAVLGDHPGPVTSLRTSWQRYASLDGFDRPDSRAWNGRRRRLPVVFTGGMMGDVTQWCPLLPDALAAADADADADAAAAAAALPVFGQRWVARRRFLWHQQTVRALDLDDTVLVTGGDDGAVVVWNHDTGTCLYQVALALGPVQTVRLHPCGMVVLSGTTTASGGPGGGPSTASGPEPRAVGASRTGPAHDAAGASAEAASRGRRGLRRLSRQSAAAERGSASTDGARGAGPAATHLTLVEWIA